MTEPIVFFGTESVSGVTLKSLIAAGWPVELVITKPDARRNRSKQLVPPEVKRIAQMHDIPVLQPTSLQEALPQLEKLSSNLAVVVAYGKIIPQSVIDVFAKGIVNIHFSLLPKFRGAAPIEYAILKGEKKTGIALMKLELKLDEGPVYFQSEQLIKPTDTQESLYRELAILGSKYLNEKLPLIAEGLLRPEAQTGQASYAPTLAKSDGEIDWVNETAEQIDRKVRAFNVWPKTKTTINSRQVAILEVKTIKNSGEPGMPFLYDDDTLKGQLAVYAKSGALIIKKLQPAGKNAMSGKAFLAGNPIP